MFKKHLIFLYYIICEKCNTLQLFMIFCVTTMVTIYRQGQITVI